MKQKLFNLIKYLDFFGINFNFKYKHHDIFKSFMGGITFIIFLISTIIYTLISSFIFFKREKISVNYYDSQISKTDIISFQNYSYGIGFLGNCDNNKANELFSDLFSYDFTFISITKSNNNFEKKRYLINTHLCTYSDFYYNAPETLDLMGVTGTYFCPDNLNYTMKGVYTDKEFNYYEISVYAKYNNEEYYEKYYDLLTNNDCKLHFFFPINSVNMNNYSYPFKYNLIDLFLQLNPVTISKRNIFFKIQKFINYQNYFFDVYNTKYYLDYSLYEDYNLYRSNERFTKQNMYYDTFAKIYLRADSKRTNISRQYEKISILIAGITSIFSTIFLFLNITLSFFEKFYSHNSIIRKIFKFNGIRDTDTFKLINDLQKKLKIDKNLKSQKINYNVSKFEQNEFNMRKKSLLINKSDTNIQRLIFYNKTKDDKKEKNQSESLLSFMKNENSGNKSSKSNLNILSNSFDIKNSFNFTNPIIIKKFEKRENLSLKYNLYEFFSFIFCQNLSKGKLSIKHKYMNKAIEILFNNLDIHIYFKKMQMIELFNFSLFKPYQNTILQFLSKPYLSISSYKCHLIDLLPKMYKTEFTKKELNDFIIGYKKIKEMKKKNYTEEKLCDMINLEIENLYG